MTPFEMLTVLVFAAVAVYRQTKAIPLVREGRFKLAAVFVVVGLVVGGFDLPSGWSGWTLLGVKLLLGVLVGIARGRRVTLWRDCSSQPHARGNRVTIGLFLGLLAVRSALSLWAHASRIDDGAGVGEVLVMIGLMIAMQTEILWRRAQILPLAHPPKKAQAESR